MRWKASPQEFQVEEEVRLPLAERGPYTVYRVVKWGQDTLSVQAQMARRLGVPLSRVVFPALKDRMARTVQVGAVAGEGPPEVRGRGFAARRIGYAPRPPRPEDLLGNRFQVVLRDLTPQEREALPRAVLELAKEGFPNYYDDQRFGSWVEGYGPFGRALLAEEEETALRLLLATPWVGDPKEVRHFKEQARNLWGRWALLLRMAPGPSTLRSVLTYLKDHPRRPRGALARLNPRLVGLWLDALRAWVWNRALDRVARTWGPGVEVEVRGTPHFAPLRPHPDRARDLLPLPHPRAEMPPPWREAMEEALRELGLSAHALNRARRLGERPPPTRRPVWTVPRQVALSAGPEEGTLLLRFLLPPGAYGTLFLKVLQARLAAAGPSAP